MTWLVEMQMIFLGGIELTDILDEVKISYHDKQT